MFKNHEFRIKLVKTPKESIPAPTMNEILNPDSVKLIEETGRRFVKHLAIAVVAVAASITVVDSLGEIAVHYGTKK